MSRPANTTERRGQIIRGLLKVMATRGFDGATTQDIAKAARLTPGLVHYHFGTKQEVLEALVDSLMKEHLERLDARVAAAGQGALNRVDAFIDAHLATGATSDPDALAVWVSLGAEALKSAAVRKRYVKALTVLHQRVLAFIEAGQRTKELNGDVSADAVASALLASIEGYFVIAATARELIPHSSAAPAVRAMARGLLLKERAR